MKYTKLIKAEYADKTEQEYTEFDMFDHLVDSIIINLKTLKRLVRENPNWLTKANELVKEGKEKIYQALNQPVK